MMLSRILYSASLLSLFSTATPAVIDQSSYSAGAILSRDIVVIGGGSSGTYAAVQLKQAGYSVALVEREDRLGGHVDTFRDPATGGTFDYGVIAFLNTSVVRDYFALLGESLGVYTGGDPSVTSAYADFKKDGKIITPPSSLPWTDPAAVFTALQGYGAQISKYPFLPDGYNLPNPVPADLLLPFGDFLVKYNLQAMAELAFTFVQGVGNLLNTPTIYVFKYIPKTTVDAFTGLAPPPVTSANHNIQGLYDKAVTYLGGSNNVFLKTSVIGIDRRGPRVLVAIRTPSGAKLISAKKLLIAIQPKVENLQELNLDLVAEETGIFNKFTNSFYWDIILKNSGLPSNLSITNIDLTAPLGIPPLPGLYNFFPSPIKGYTTSYFSSGDSRTDAQVKAETLATVAKIISANGLSTPGTGSPQIVGFNNHKPFWLRVPPATIASGFYNNLNALQGKRNTWWTGATFVAHDSSAIWSWEHGNLLPKLKASL